MPTLLRILTALALAVWLGSMLFFSAGVAPVAFTVLPTRVMAGNMVSGAMHSLNVIAYSCGGLLVLLYAVRSFLKPGRREVLKAGLAALMLAIALYSGLAVTPPLANIRAEYGAIDALPANDPERERFNQLHKLSEALMGLNLIGAIALVILEQLPGKEA